VGGYGAWNIKYYTFELMNTSAAFSENTKRLRSWLIPMLRNPSTGQKLSVAGDVLVSVAPNQAVDEAIHIEEGIPLFANQFLGASAKTQQAHYDAIANAYIANLAYPHTLEYSAYLDSALLKRLDAVEGYCVLEVCCGQGDALKLIGSKLGNSVGLDVSHSMLKAAQAVHSDEKFAFVQGDATHMPLADSCFDMVVMLGGIHHVPERAALFSEVFRVLKPGGRFVFREPVSDFFLWQWLRAVIYKISPMLDEKTERPLLWQETVPILEKAGFTLKSWRTFGGLGFILLMNSDVLYFNRAFRWIPGIRTITKAFVAFDEWITSKEVFHKWGLQVIAEAIKPTLDSETKQ
jgi:ubiquinone/menaquinone biosynthesis C-methylase UbiE